MLFTKIQGNLQLRYKPGFWSANGLLISKFNSQYYQNWESLKPSSEIKLKTVSFKARSQSFGVIMDKWAHLSVNQTARYAYPKCHPLLLLLHSIYRLQVTDKGCGVHYAQYNFRHPISYSDKVSKLVLNNAIMSKNNRDKMSCYWKQWAKCVLNAKIQYKVPNLICKHQP